MLSVCSRELDIVFVLDASNTVGATNFATLKEAVRQAGLYFNIGPNLARVGVVAFSLNQDISLNLQNVWLTDNKDDFNQGNKYLKKFFFI